MIKENKYWKPQIDEYCNIIEPYPEVIDFCGEHDLDLDFDLDPKIYLSDDHNLKKITAPSNEIGISYIDIRNLPNLEEIIIDGEFTKHSNYLQWVEIEDCPSLKKISIRGGVISLSICDNESLECLDINGCKAIDHVFISSPSEKLKIDARGCLKLRKVLGLNDYLQKSSGLLDQIIENQKSSREDGCIYDCMTFTDVDFVEKLINEGVKALSRMSLSSSEDLSDFDRYGQLAKDKNFNPFGYRILSPLEPVYTGGTGETYGYVSTQRFADRDGVSSYEEEIAGNTSPEDCLRYMLHTIRMMDSGIPGIDKYTDNELLEFFLLSAFKENNLEPARSNFDKLELVKVLQNIWYWRFTDFCLSGKLRVGKKKKELAALIAAAGFNLVDDIQKGLSFLAHDDPESTGWKVVRAKKLGISVISEEELRTILAAKAEHDKFIRLNFQISDSSEISL